MAGLRFAILEPLPHLADRFAAMLREAGHDIVPPGDGPDAVLVSHHGWTGQWKAVVKEQDCADAPVIVSAVGVRADAVPPRGAAGLLSRPFTAADLRRAMEHAAKGGSPALFGPLVPTRDGGTGVSIVIEKSFVEEAEAAQAAHQSVSADAREAAGGRPRSASDIAARFDAELQDAIERSGSHPAAPTADPSGAKTDKDASPPPQPRIIGSAVDADRLVTIASEIADRVDEWSALPEGKMRARLIEAFLKKRLGT